MHNFTGNFLARQLDTRRIVAAEDLKDLVLGVIARILDKLRYVGVLLKI